MKVALRGTTLVAAVCFLISNLQAQSYKYNWANDYDSNSALINRIPLPVGYQRTALELNSYADWLRHFPVKDGQKRAYSYDGRPAMSEDVVFAVLDIDIGSSDLQQCADAIIRLHAEYLYAYGDYRNIKYNFTSGDTSRFDDWIEGYRPLVRRNKVSWARSAKVDSSYQSFRNYLEMEYHRFHFVQDVFLGRQHHSRHVGAVGTLRHTVKSLFGNAQRLADLFET